MMTETMAIAMKTTTETTATAMKTTMETTAIVMTTTMETMAIVVMMMTTETMEMAKEKEKVRERVQMNIESSSVCSIAIPAWKLHVTLFFPIFRYSFALTM